MKLYTALKGIQGIFAVFFFFGASLAVQRWSRIATGLPANHPVGVCDDLRLSRLGSCLVAPPHKKRRASYSSHTNGSSDQAS